MKGPTMPPRQTPPGTRLAGRENTHVGNHTRHLSNKEELTVVFGLIWVRV